jgi:hypothetical protein
MLPTKNVYDPWPLTSKDQSSSIPSGHLTYFHSTGEIDIVESRGNGIEYTAQYVSLLSSFQTLTINYQLNSGSNFIQGSLNWGPTSYLNGVSKSYNWWTENRTSFASGFHTYVLECEFVLLFSFFTFTNPLNINPNRRIYVDTRLHTLLDFRFNQPFFHHGDGSYSTPFDQGLSFFLAHHSLLKTLLYRILPQAYHDRGRLLYQWMVPRRSRQKTVD